MQKTRELDKRAIILQRTGKIGGYASSLGQEAISIAIADTMKKKDVLIPHYRDHGAQMIRGNSIFEMLAIWGGNEEGNNYKAETVKNDLPMLIPIASQCLHAAGIAYAMKYKKEKNIAVCICGDGGTSQGDFYEALNVAGVWKLPVLFIINNNQWAISMPRSLQTASKTLSQKAIAAGMDGIQVDGNDIIALKNAFESCCEIIRNESTPLLVEAISYRLNDHTTADDASRYQETSLLETASKKDPIARLKKYLSMNNILSDTEMLQREEKIANDIESEIKEYEQMLEVNPSFNDIFDYMYETPPKSFYLQKEILQKEQM